MALDKKSIYLSDSLKWLNLSGNDELNVQVSEVLEYEIFLIRFERDFIEE